jgi:hypothetical protein
MRSVQIIGISFYVWKDFVPYLMIQNGDFAAVRAKICIPIGGFIVLTITRPDSGIAAIFP